MSIAILTKKQLTIDIIVNICLVKLQKIAQIIVSRPRVISS